MRIILLMDPLIPVPPLHYGGIERVIHDIACRYVDMGHRVTLIAGPGSTSPDRLITFGEAGKPHPKADFGLLWRLARILHEEIPVHDVVHNFGRLAFQLPMAWSGIRKLQTYMRTIAPRNIRTLGALGVRNLTYTAVSDAIVRTGQPGGGDWRTVYNCAPLHQFTFVDHVAPDAPLVFLGRLERCKGAHSAIRVAELTGRKLIVAGNVSTLPDERAYFEKELQPRFGGEQVEYIGVVDNVQKDRLLGSAAALLLPVEWYEPFPVVLPEAFACGTPILAFPGGGIPEGIRSGVTGFLSQSAEEMAQDVGRIGDLSRAACREEAVSRYSDQVIAEAYLKIYAERP